MLITLKSFIEDLRIKWFSVGDDQIWRRWVDGNTRGMDSLIVLLNQDVRESIKRRAVFLLLVPFREYNPIYWKGELGGFDYRFPNFLEGLTSELLNYATDLVIGFCKILKPLHSDRPTIVMREDRTPIVVRDEYHSPLCFYNTCILTLLGLLPQKRCEEIFPQLSLRDISTFESPECVSGYHPFETLLRMPKIDIEWKKRADQEMRKIIELERARLTSPREDWEDALKCYATIIQAQLHNQLNYSRDLFESQVEFILEKWNFGRQLIAGCQLLRLLNHFSGERYEELRHRIAQFVVFDKFVIYDIETTAAASKILAEFGTLDSELAECLNKAFADSRERVELQEYSQLKERQTEEGLISEMG
ncbi:MAG: hypothetical protein WAV73_01490 [Candidatus Moraniibacteriota bacterium]